MGVHDISQLPVVMQRYAKSLPLAIEEAVKMIAQPGFNTMVDATPVDTTTAVSNWVVTHGSPNSIFRPARVPGSIKGSGAGAAKSGVKADGRMQISFYKLSTPMFIANVTPYIGYLEHGGPNIGPHNMVGQGVRVMMRTAKSIRILKMTEDRV